MKKTQTLFRTALLPSLIVAASQIAFAADNKVVAPGTMTKPTASAAGTSAVSPHFMRASKLVGMNVHGADGNNVGEITDLIVNLSTGDVRYAVFEYDPGVFKAEKVFAVPIQDMDMSADGKTLNYKNMSREQLDRSGVDKKDWKTAVANTRHIENMDIIYGYTPNKAQGRVVRASDVIGMDVNSRQGEDIGDIKELVIDMNAGKVRYAVLAFDPSWLTGEKLYAFPLSSFSARQGEDEMMLNVSRDKLTKMKSFEPDNWDRMSDSRAVPVNTIAARTQ
jgi:sporulation protein YlmC with PRC-barrel domain